MKDYQGVNAIYTFSDKKHHAIGTDGLGLFQYVKKMETTSKWSLISNKMREGRHLAVYPPHLSLRRKQDGEYSIFA